MIFILGFILGLMVGIVAGLGLMLACWAFTEYYSRDRSKHTNPIAVNRSKKSATIITTSSLADDIMEDNV